MRAVPADWERTPPARPRSRRRLAVVHHTDGPRIRLGVAWCAALLGAAAVSPTCLALVLAPAAGLAADQVVRLRWGTVVPVRGDGSGRPVAVRWRPVLVLLDPRRLPAVLGAAALPLAAAAGAETLALALPFVVLVVLVHRLLTPTDVRAVPEIALVLAAAVTFGLAAAGPVLAARLGRPVGVVLLLLVCAYDAGDFLVGTDATTVWEGPAAGMVAVAVFGFAASVVPGAPLDQGSVLAMTAVVAVLAPLGGPAASLLIGGDGRLPARFVRRVDSLLLLGPVSAWAILSFLPQPL